MRLFCWCSQQASAWRPVRVAAMTMQERGGNRDKVFVKGKESIERAKQLDKVCVSVCVCVAIFYAGCA